MQNVTVALSLVMLTVAGVAATEDFQTRWNPQVPSIGTKNLIPNGSFECGASGWIPCGKSTGWGGNLAGNCGAVEVGGAQDGENSLRIDLGPGKTLETFYDCWPPARVRQATVLAANAGWIRVEKGQAYTLSAYMKADRDGIPATLSMRFAQAPGPFRLPIERSTTSILSTDWQRYSCSFPAESADVFVAIGPDLGATPEAAATVWLDAVQLERAEGATDFQPRQPVEVGFETLHPGNLYDSKESCKIAAQVCNTTDTPSVVRIDVSVEDYFGARLPAKTVRIEVQPHALAVRHVPLKISGPGHYRVTCSWESQGTQHATTLTLVVVDTYSEDDSPFGINHAPVMAELCGTLRKGGIVWARDWSPNWQFIEPVQGQVKFADTDLQIDRVLQTGMRVMSVLPSNPSTNWASEAPASVPATLWKRLAYAPADPRLLNEFVAKVVSRYRDRVKEWEFLNEPIWSPDFCMPKEGGYTVVSYVSLLKGAYEAMKTADPACRVIGGLSAEAMFSIGDDFIRAGGLNFVDIYNLHPYPDPGTSPPEQLIGHMERILGIMDANGGRKPIWATETGYYAMDEKPWEPWTPPAGVHGADILLRDERQCGDYTVRYSVILLSHGVDKIFFHQGIAGEPNCGLRNMDNPLLGPQGVPTKAYAALAGLANALGPAPKYVASLAKPVAIDGRETKGVYGYAFQCGRKAAMVAWAPDADDVRWDLNTPHGVTARNIVGNKMEGHRFRLGESPIYVESFRADAHALAETCTLTLGR